MSRPPAVHTSTRGTPSRLRVRAKLASVVLAMPLLVSLAWWLEDRDLDLADQPAPATEVLVDRAVGLRVGYPPTWRHELQTSAHRLVSPGRAVTVIVGSPRSGSFPGLARRDATRAMLRAHRPPRVIGRGPGQFAGRPVVNTELAGTGRDRRPVRILVIGTASRWRTYTVAVFSAMPPSAARLQEVQSILRATTFFQPRGRGQS